MVIRFRCFQDYYSLLWHLETIKSDGMRRASWLSAFVVFKTITVSFPSRDNQVRWHAKTIMVIRFHYFQDYFSLLCLPETIKSIGMRR